MREGLETSSFQRGKLRQNKVLKATQVEGMELRLASGTEPANYAVSKGGWLTFLPRKMHLQYL